MRIPVKTSRITFLLSAVVAASVWTTASTVVSGANGPGFYATRNGFRAPLYGTSTHLGADGVAVAECGMLAAPEVDAARVGRQVSRTMLAASPQAVVGTEGGATFDVKYIDAEGTGFNDAATGATRRRAFEAAVTAWSKVIKTTVPITIEATMRDQPDLDNDPTTNLLAFAGPTEFWLIDNKVVPSALAWQMLGGKVENAKDSDITVSINDKTDWDYALNGVAARNKTSFVYTLRHELGHGLGIVASLDGVTGKPLNDPLVFVFDEFLNRGSSQRNRLLDHAEEERLRDMKSNDLFFNGENATEASLKSIKPLPMVKLYAPATFRNGSSVTHVDQETYADVRTGLMVPTSFGSGYDRIDILTLGIIKDLGYTMTENPPLPTTTVTTRARE
jgi:hypothetical protein